MDKYTNERFSWEYSLNRNTVNLFGPVDTRMAEIVIGQLQYLDNKFKVEDVPPEERIITLQINSPGGSVTDGLAIYDTMNYIDAKIVTVGIGQAASMGAFLLCSGTRGMRRAKPYRLPPAPKDSRRIARKAPPYGKTSAFSPLFLPAFR